MRSYYLPDLDAYIRSHELPGAGPVRLYLHGFPWASSACFPAVAAHPALHGRRSLLVDLLGFGFSDGPPGFSYTAEEQAGVLARLLDALKVKDCQVVGQSWGGTVAVALAGRRWSATCPLPPRWSAPSRRRTPWLCTAALGRSTRPTAGRRS